MNIATSIETSIESSALMSIGTQIGHPIETSAESTTATTRAETPIDIVTTTRTHPLDAMMDFLRRLGIAIVHVAGMVESISGWCFSTWVLARVAASTAEAISADLRGNRFVVYPRFLGRGYTVDMERRLKVEH
jgi:hypothetical protein